MGKVSATMAITEDGMDRVITMQNIAKVFVCRKINVNMLPTTVDQKSYLTEERKHAVAIMKHLVSYWFPQTFKGDTKRSKRLYPQVSKLFQLICPRVG